MVFITFFKSSTHRFNPIPIASVATIILHLWFGSLNLADCTIFVLGGNEPYITATSCPLCNREETIKLNEEKWLYILLRIYLASISVVTVYKSFLLKHTMQSPGCKFSSDSTALFSTVNLVSLS